MKKYIKIVVFSLLCYGCKAQSINEIMRLSELKENWFKDTNNELNAYEGTYVYTNGTTSLKMVLQKKIQSDYYNGDILIGEYQYIENGVEKINTLPKLSIPYTDMSDFNISGSDVMTGKGPGCKTCDKDDKRLMAYITDPVVGKHGNMILRPTTVNGKAALEMGFGWRMQGINEGDPEPKEAALGSGAYLLIKQ